MAEVTLAEVARPAGRRAGADVDLPVYSVTKHAGFVPSLEYFKKQVFSRDVADYKLVEPGDFAYATIHLDEGSIGIAPERALISPMYTVFGVDDSLVDRSYLVRFLKSPRALAHYPQLGKGAVHRRKAISFAALGGLKVPLPPLSEQRRIAAILDHADALRAKRRQVLAQLDTLTQSIFHDLLGDPVSNPKGWRESHLGDQAVRLQYGPRFYNEEYSSDGIPIVRITDLDFSGHLNFEGMPRMKVSDEDVAKHALTPGEIVFARTGATVGKTALIRESNPVCIAGAYFIRLQFNESVMPEYAFAVLRSRSIQSIIWASSHQSAQQNFSGPGLRALPMPVPPLDLQIEFAKRVEAINTQKSTVRQAFVSDDELFASIKSRAFQGEL